MERESSMLVVTWSGKKYDQRTKQQKQNKITEIGIVAWKSFTNRSMAKDNCFRL